MCEQLESKQGFLLSQLNKTQSEERRKRVLFRRSSKGTDNPKREPIYK